jgi:hypothetical protein
VSVHKNYVSRALLQWRGVILIQMSERRWKKCTLHDCAVRGTLTRRCSNTLLLISAAIIRFIVVHLRKPRCFGCRFPYNTKTLVTRRCAWHSHNPARSRLIAAHKLSPMAGAGISARAIVSGQIVIIRAASLLNLHCILISQRWR